MSTARRLWAKSTKDGKGHSLLAHLIDVGLVAQRLVQEDRLQAAIKRFAHDLNLELLDAMRLIVVLAALHDIGKASPTFQAKWPPGAPAEALKRPFEDIPHGVISAVVLKKWLKGLGMHHRGAETLAHAVGVHHGAMLAAGFDRDLGEATPSIGSSPWSDWRAELIGAVVAVFGPLPEFERIRGYRSALSWALLAGLTATADWIGSGLPHTRPLSDSEAYVAQRMEAVDTRLEELHWLTGGTWWTPPKEPEKFSSWFMGTLVGEQPRPLQLAVQDALAALRDAAGLVIIEAPMGEGKTEAAFFASVRSSTGGGAYFGMPTQATSDAMHGRLAAFTARHATRNVSMSLAHGAARLLTNLAATPHVSVSPILAPEADLSLAPVEHEGLEAAAVQVRWFSIGRKELLSELGVGTIDQALQAVLPVKHFFVRLVALAGKVVVLDEVHAYDAYTKGLIEELVRWLACLGSRVIVMSATLPESTRLALVAAYCEGMGIEPSPPKPAAYPRLTLVSPMATSTNRFSAARSLSVQLEPAPFGIDELAELASRLRTSGGAVGVVVNTVDRAQRLYRACRRLGQNPILLHARMPLIERKNREAELLRLFGPASRGQRTGLVIATQVVEQSLDVDFDVLLTDLAPVDLVLQRSGREHRHAWRSERGPHRSPVMYIAGLGTVETGPDEEATRTVYDPYILWRSWAVLVDTKELALPNDIDSLVQAVYKVDLPLERLAAYTQRMAELEQHFTTQTIVKRGTVNAWLTAQPTDPAVNAWEVSATDGEERPSGRVVAPTRLGDRGTSTIPLFQTTDGWRLPGETGASVPRSGRLPRDWARLALMCQLSVRNDALTAKLEAAERPDWWTKEKVLGFVHPLVLDEDGVALVDPNVRLDSELGLVISRHDLGKGEVA